MVNHLLEKRSCFLDTNKLKGILLEPDKEPCIVEVGSDFISMQELVGGILGEIQLFQGTAAIIYNDEGMLMGYR